MPELPIQKNILVAPLNWGLGHATRCIPIIRALEANGYTPILASDGAALQLLKREFPKLLALELPSYQIEYPREGKHFKWKMLQNLPKMMEAVSGEKKIVKQWVKQYNLWGIISDNRLGVVSKKVPSVFITHQLNVLTGNTTWLTGKLHRMIIEKFTECWIPDVDDFINLSGKLGHLKDADDLHLKYIGPLSRFEPMALPAKYDLMVMLSGPEPQRGMLQEQLEREVMQFDGKVVFVKGVMEAEQKKIQLGNVTYYNFMTSSELEKTVNESKLVLCRSGYTTVMDLAKLGKKAFFIPTPGQYEQEYLARKFKKEGLVPYAKQEHFRLEKLTEVDLYKGLPHIPEKIHWKNLFCLFERE
ncbi:Glycosyltransferase [Flavobacterium longum]|uniref:glycosyltransferase n=1 Tax=Flavobacterium longum TaxID=1299340 RepID=UPI0039EB1132